jgi:Ca2+/Na+ antiporter
MMDPEACLTNRCFKSADFGQCKSVCDNNLETCCHSADGGLAVAYLVVVVYLFIGIAVVCDEWFVPSLEEISSTLKLSEDVAGATFMAAGSSAPELFTSMADAFGDQSSMGVGTIVGSAMFNILVIVALAIAASKNRPTGKKKKKHKKGEMMRVDSTHQNSLKIDWRCVVRDCSFYVASIVMMVIVFNDSVVYWYESMVMVLMYFVYILFMYFNETILGKCEKEKSTASELNLTKGYKAGRRDSVHQHKGMFQSPVEHRKIHPEAPLDQKARETLGPDKLHELEELRQKKEEAKKAETAEKAAGPKSGDHIRDDVSCVGEVEETGESDDEDEDEEEETIWERFAAPDGPGDWPLYLASLPFILAFTLTIPDCAKKKYKRWFVVTFINSIAWIGIICYGMVHFASLAGCIIGIDPPVMGITLLAIGTSVPDALGSIIVAKAGEADMAIANAVGSNVFDILLGLGLPWMLASWTYGKPARVDKNGIEVAVGILLGTVFLFFGTLVWAKWRMRSSVGFFYIALYLLYVLWTLLIEYCVIPVPWKKKDLVTNPFGKCS